jgi:hypothetical protein
MICMHICSLFSNIILFFIVGVVVVVQQLKKFFLLYFFRTFGSYLGIQNHHPLIIM